MNTIISGTSRTGGAFLRMGSLLVKSGIPRASGSRSGNNFSDPVGYRSGDGFSNPNKKIYTLKEERGALGRHTVARQKISPANLLGLGLAGGIAGAVLGEAAPGCSWTTVAAMSAIGSATSLAIARASNKPEAPLDSACQKTL